MAEEVRVLKNFRDSILLSTSIRRSFVEFYYEVSPPMADFISNHDTSRAVVRWSLLPLMVMSWAALRIVPVALPALIVVFISSLVIGCAKFFQRRIRGQRRRDRALG
jgi:hypothetical protein